MQGCKETMNFFGKEKKKIKRELTKSDCLETIYSLKLASIVSAAIEIIL